MDNRRTVRCFLRLRVSIIDMLELIFNYLASTEELEEDPCDIYLGDTLCSEDIECGVDICAISFAEGSSCG